MLLLIVLGILFLAFSAGFKVRVEAEYDFARVFTRILIIIFLLLVVAFLINADRTVDNLTWLMELAGIL